MIALSAGVLVTAALPVRAQNPRRLAVAREARLAFAYPNVMFDAAKTRYDHVPVKPAVKAAEAAGPKGWAAGPKGWAAGPKGWAAYRRPQASRLHQELVVPVPQATPAYRRTFRIMLANPDKTDRWDELILRYARIYRLDSRLLKSIMAAESEFNPQALSPAGARGLMQVMPATSEGVGIAASRLHRPAAGVKAGAAYLQNLFKAAWNIFHLKGVRYTDAPMWVVQRVIAAYHAGPRFLTRLHLYASTRAYVRKVVLFYHSSVTDLRRPAAVSLELPAYHETVTPSGSMH